MEAIVFVFIILQIFYTRPHFGRLFLKAFERQSNSDGAQNIASLVEMISFIHFSNLLEVNT